MTDKPQTTEPEVTLVCDTRVPTSWAVEAIFMDADGACERASFSGPDCETSARSYARWRYPDNHLRVMVV